MTTKFERICRTYMPRLINDLGITVLDAAAVFGNGGHESGGFATLQETKPTVKGSAGGYGWFQWTGPRRRTFTAFCEENNLKPADDEANYLFLVHELMTSEKAALKALTKANTLDTKVVAFELAFERAGIKHYDSRKSWALKALHAYEAITPVVNVPVEAPIRPGKPVQSEEPVVVPNVPQKEPSESEAFLKVLSALVAAGAIALGNWLGLF